MSVPVLTWSENKSTSLCSLYKSFVNYYPEHASGADFVARAPGRVNLIGEHVDYCGYSVLPMALDQDVSMAVKVVSSGTIRLKHVSSEYASAEFQVTNLPATVGSDGVSWIGYFICGLRGIIDHIGSVPKWGLDVLVSGSVPPSSGLSSSSALVVCSSLVCMRGQSLNLDRAALAVLCAKCERYIGTEGGGMDQAVSICAHAGQALWIDFTTPLTTVPVSLPNGAAFVVAHSCIRMNKAATLEFNERVAECRTATKLLTKLSVEEVDWRSLKRLVEVQNVLNVANPSGMLPLVESNLHKEPYTLKELADLFGCSEEEVRIQCLTASSNHLTSFELHKRATHVYSESGRVLKFRDLCQQPISDGDSSGSDRLRALGQLMSDSHASCSKLYQCSHPQLDLLVDTCMSAGALGSRLTGAGWGGCCVSLVANDTVDAFVERVRSQFCDKSGVDKDDFMIFPSLPGSGAYFIEGN